MPLYLSGSMNVPPENAFTLEQGSTYFIFNVVSRDVTYSIFFSEKISPVAASLFDGHLSSKNLLIS